MIIKRNAEEILKDHFYRNNVMATRKTLETNIKNNYLQKFFQELQIYVTKIGIALSECVEDVRLYSKTYYGTIEFICLKLLKNKQMFDVMEAIGINDKGNAMKHSNNDVKGSIDYTLSQYNQFISQIYKATKLQNVKLFFINRKKNDRDIELIKEEKHHKYFMINDVKFQFKINPNYTLDPYTKTAQSKITLFWPDGKKDFYVDLFVENEKNNHEIVREEKIDISKDESKRSINFRFKEGDLDRRVISMRITIILYKKVNNYYTTGHLFWKQQHSYTSYEEVSRRTLKNVSQLFYPDHKK